FVVRVAVVALLAGRRSVRALSRDLLHDAVAAALHRAALRAPVAARRVAVVARLAELGLQHAVAAALHAAPGAAPVGLDRVAVVARLGRQRTLRAGVYEVLHDPVTAALDAAERAAPVAVVAVSVLALLAEGRLDRPVAAPRVRTDEVQRGR